MDHSPLGALPPELRATVFVLALHRDHPVMIEKGDADLSFTCRQIRDECLLMHYDVNRRMTLLVPFGNTINIDHKLQSLAKLGKLRFLEHLTIEVECGLYKGSRADDTGFRSLEWCTRVAHMLVGPIGLSYEQAEWLCVGNVFWRNARPGPGYKPKLQLFKSIVEGVKEDWKLTADAASKARE
ncbi:hypothetical protein LTR78_003508 [Recurvomyces mirabilis]|uniref:Uncharacterized protein n=1 Tax=Recurvomyces mirabilis TaxID=574656 RepID=A0AAE0WRS5_9PEZI|nr:hypothetical protein LTR78_003508 [Recurvomyces mirabilis]KAK5154459.1 hypothetical protein LTS14_006594 [Recurvomyces mirabilis]